MTETRSADELPPADELVPLDHARKYLVPRRPDGEPVNPSTMWRWSHKGLEGLEGERITLTVTYVGCRPYVTRQGIDDFFQAVTEARLERHQRALELQADVTADELESAGLA